MRAALVLTPLLFDRSSFASKRDVRAAAIASDRRDPHLILRGRPSGNRPAPVLSPASLRRHRAHGRGVLSSAMRKARQPVVELYAPVRGRGISSPYRPYTGSYAG